MEIQSTEMSKSQQLNVWICSKPQKKKRTWPPRKEVQDPDIGLWRPGYISEGQKDDIVISLASDPPKMIGEIPGKRMDQLDTEEIVEQLGTESFDLRKRNDESLINVSDMILLPYLNEPEMIECLSQRFSTNSIYTNSGPILFALNPWQTLRIYDENLDIYSRSDLETLRHLDPHIFQISKLAHLQMLSDGTRRLSQSIVVNGESGSGKTESAKYCLRMFSAISRDIIIQSSAIPSSCTEISTDDTIDAANAITESFGHARTSRNPSSSRFGKFIKLLYCGPRSRRGAISGLTLNTYLLESVRVVQQTQGERNFHIFYEMLAGLDDSQLSALHLSELSRFFYTSQSEEYSRGDGVSDADNFGRLVAAMERIGLDSNLRDRVFKIVACILHIGNLQFQNKPGTVFTGVDFADDCRTHITAIELLTFGSGAGGLAGSEKVFDKSKFPS